MIESFPLYWPEGWRRTKPSHRYDQRLFRQTFGRARDELLAEIGRLGGKNVILSTNIPLRNDGLPRADAREPEDPGVAVYFDYNKKPMCFASDRYYYVRQNIRAIALTIDALRGIERWGASDMMERAFRGFTSIEDKRDEPWRSVLGFSESSFPSLEEMMKQYRELAKRFHPDAGGSVESFQRIQRARVEAEHEIIHTGGA
jgi:hypothetical protein